MTSQVTAYLLTNCVAFVKCVFKTLLLGSFCLATILVRISISADGVSQDEKLCKI